MNTEQKWLPTLSRAAAAGLGGLGLTLLLSWLAALAMNHDVLPGADTRLTEAEALGAGLIDDCRVFHFGTLSLTDEPVRSATRAAVARAKAQGKLISLDPNLRKPLWSSLSEAKEAIEEGLRLADAVKLSDDEMEFLMEGESLEQRAVALVQKFGIRFLIVTGSPSHSSRVLSASQSAVDTACHRRTV